MYFVCHMTPQNHSVEMSCLFMGDSSSQHVTKPEKFGQKHESDKYVVPLKN